MSLRSLIGGVLLDPLALLWLASLALLVAPLLARRRTGGTIALALGWSLGVPLVSAPAFVDPVIAAVEARAPGGPFPPPGPGEGAPACAPGTPIVVLGGGVDHAELDPARWEALGRWAVPRVAAGARLAAADPAATVVVSGGRLGALAEAEVMAGLLVRLGVAPSRIVREGASRNTAENAALTRALFGSHPALPVGSGERPRARLVTTALHMRRAAESFARAGFALCAVPVGHLARPSGFTWRVVPHVEALARTGYLIHESVGRAFYRLRRGAGADPVR